MGKFPAPLLMNFVHFSMQAIISLTITKCWPQKFQPSVSMSSKDFLLRGIFISTSLFFCPFWSSISS